MKPRNVIFALIVVAMLCGSASAVVITDYGNGVLYFHKASAHALQFGCDYLEAGAAISQYLTVHSEKHVVSIAPDAFVGYGNTGGFYVIVENKTVSKMTCTPIWDGTSVGTTAIVNYNCVTV
jgi:hypothetical protein